jgi:DNA-binding NtrC family response regulator
VLPGVNGLEILKLIKKLKKEIIVVTMSGYATEAKAKFALKMGAFDYLNKPFDMKHIEDMLQMIKQSML